MRAIPYEIGCQLSPSGGGETLVLCGRAFSMLVFRAVTRQSGLLVDAGVAVLKCEGCVATRFGYPNDKGLSEHPLYGSGQTAFTSSVLEMLDSTWPAEVRRQLLASKERIWGASGSGPERTLCHFQLASNEATFECIAERLTIMSFHPTFAEAWSVVMQQVEKR